MAHSMMHTLASLDGLIFRYVHKDGVGSGLVATD
jgi:hypothetical protein